MWIHFLPKFSSYLKSCTQFFIFLVKVLLGNLLFPLGNFLCGHLGDFFILVTIDYLAPLCQLCQNLWPLKHPFLFFLVRHDNYLVIAFLCRAREAGPSPPFSKECAPDVKNRRQDDNKEDRLESTRGIFINCQMGYLFMCMSLSHSNWGGNIVEHFSKADGEMN